MSKTPIFDPGTSEIRSPLLAGLSEGVSKVSDILDIETASNTITLNNVQITDTDKNRIYQASFGSRLWLESPKPVIKKNGVIITEENDNFAIDYVGGSISFDKNYRLDDNDVVTADVTYCINKSKLITRIENDIKNLSDEFSEFTDFISGEGSPTTETEGELGQDYVDTVTGEKYHLVSIDGGNYIWVKYQDKLNVDESPTKDSNNFVSSGTVYDSLIKKQDKLTGNSGQLIGINDNGVANATTYPSNPNMLDNWYFVDPIIQRGEKEYAGSGYTIDRWKAVNDLKVTVKDDNVALLNNATNTSGFLQPFEFPLKETTTFTLSILVADKVNQVRLCLNDTSFYTHSYVDVDGAGLYSCTGTVSTGKTLMPEIVLFGKASVSILAIKLELGSVQTLAHKENDKWVLNDPPPDPALELAKCQRYQVVYKISGNYVSRIGIGRPYSDTGAYIEIFVPHSLRVTPDLVFKNVKMGLFVGTYSDRNNMVDVLYNAHLSSFNNDIFFWGLLTPKSNLPTVVRNDYSLYIYVENPDDGDGYLVIDANL